MDKVNNNKAANKAVNKNNKASKTKTVKTKMVKTSNNKVKPKTVNKANKVSNLTNNKVNSLITKI